MDRPLRVGDRVGHVSNPNLGLGKITDQIGAEFYVVWDNGHAGWYTDTDLTRAHDTYGKRKSDTHGL